MEKRTLQDLSKEEIGQLFPIEITTYQNIWPKLYENERDLIVGNVDTGLFSRIEHFGSTSIPGIHAKNTIDMLMEVEFEELSNKKLIEQMAVLGYEFNWQNEGPNAHMIFVKGYHVDSPKTQTYHIHAGPGQHPIWDRLLFRDYLIAHPDVAAAYGALKLRLAEEFRHDRVAYRMAKGDFIGEITGKAKAKLR